MTKEKPLFSLGSHPPKPEERMDTARLIEEAMADIMNSKNDIHGLRVIHNAEDFKKTSAYLLIRHLVEGNKNDWKNSIQRNYRRVRTF